MKDLHYSALQRFIFRISRLHSGYKVKYLSYAVIVLLLLSSIILAQGQRNTSPPPFTTTHPFLNGPDKCSTCHEQAERFSSARCLQCHGNISEQIEKKAGSHGDFGADCIVCHTLHKAEKNSSGPAAVQNYDHRTDSGFNLTGGHADLACDQCHKNGFRETLNSQCGSCHEDAHRGGLGSACGDCHSPAGFRNASRAFHKTGTFPLEGRHLSTECEACHTRGEIKGTPNRCYDCHWIRRQDDPFRTRLGNECEDCHSPISWTAVRFNHPSASGVALSAGHRTLDCRECHPDNNVFGSPVLCIVCHQDDYLAAQNPNHVTAGFSTLCEECHRISDSSFNRSSFNHGIYYPLLGAHASLDCGACHENNVYQGTPQDCYACHQSDYQNTQDPGHTAAWFPTDCELCHQPSHLSWNQGSILHPEFPINSGRHANFDCSKCHTDPSNYQVFSCFNCHDRGSMDDKHRNIAGYIYDSQACYSCHPQGRE